ncbi:uncharacterized protein EV154DRAFT_507766 [Mucor mucedo]|uniref:uncharacterized protein n=1 Tax=Mucor mucedo TaxID=29922 RepID=UPI00221FD301|nr:uncharacterized protein EV154DRAFT_507766 [Mucor mucedo]KAI7891567.1 hypothetical protein EV154DRAFT_507766 [Mucor mucedo]
MSRDLNKRRERRKNDATGRSFLQAPIILDRRERPADPVTIAQEPSMKPDELSTVIPSTSTCIPFMRRPNKFNSEAILKNLTDHPGHFVIGIIGKQGIGKSTILSHFAPDPERTFPTQSTDDFLLQGHKTEGIDMYITPERAILLDTEPICSWTVLDEVLRNGMNGLQPDIWLEMESLYNIIFLFSVCNVILVVNDGPDIDMDLLQLVQRAEMLKFCIPDFPLLVRDQQDMQYYPDIVFVCNKCTVDEFTFKRYKDLQLILTSFFEKSQLKTQGLVSLGNVLPLFKHTGSNLFFLPQDDGVESFDVLVLALRDQVLATPRKSGRKGQVSEKDWYRNAVKTFEIVRKSEYINEYLQVVRKLRDS